jgi:thioredoxin reductase (NADPH)
MEQHMQEYDVLVIGGGPAGLTAGMYTGRATLKTAIFEKMIPGGQLNNTHRIENYPGYESISGAELAEKMAKHAQAHGAEMRQEWVQEIRLAEDGHHKIVKTDKGEYKTKVVVLSPGGENRKLNVPGEKEFNGAGVSYCAICDGAFFKGETIAVVGGGDAAVEESIFLTKFGKKVIVIHRRDELRAKVSLQEEAFENEKIEFIWDSVVEEIQGEEKVTNLKLYNRKTEEHSDLAVGAVFIFIGFVPNSNMLKLDIDLDEEGYVNANTRMESSVPGIYAVGDIKPNICKQVSVSVGEGTIAAVDAERYINEGKANGWWK